ncbi:Alpha/Beta hydrolase protein [Lobosporangium transversale]|uniref:Alpha/Beta hydrolase protein n=1 Tax=Lobosporangium transversale TaxID=64571 RepID=A0A1Y2GQG0_9FUNG|nr:Alpha/Beta hydrolase protein [Lobosporangium transversale]ORZ19137.1 Alpha/Beta hydrolase protein [Lobosporangium transversale]|eukprot:XP_021882305.1 Alpha/Beta hydrolase protein [Lobosporangium transversale]
MAYYSGLRASCLYPEITIPTLGTVRGTLDKTGQVAKFLNVPVATVPERWRPAVKAQSWQGVRDATTPGPLSPQETKTKAAIFSGNPSKMDYNTHMDEYDCLGCNVYMPAIATAEDADLPVIVWAFGGGFKNGGVSCPIFDCTPIVINAIELQKPVVIVSLNYRINYFGFLTSKEMVLDAQQYASSIPPQLRTWYHNSVGNWGLLDLIMGLEWVQEHISAFSGNPKRVTLMGQSAGSTAASYFNMLPQCHGLYQRAIMQSGGVSMLPAVRPEYEGQCVFDHLCRSLQMPDDLEPLEKVAWLRAVPADVIAELLNDTPLVFFRPSIDGIICKENAQLDVCDFRKYNPNLEWVLTGTCTNEADFSFFKERICPPADYHLFDQLFGVPATNKEVMATVVNTLSSYNFEYPVYQVCEAIATHPSCHLTQYRFERGVEKLGKVMPGLGIFHGTDLFFTFGNNSHTQRILNEDERTFAKKVQAVWIEFATASSPEESYLPKMPQLTGPTTSDTTITCGGLEDQKKSEAILFSKSLEVVRTSISPMTMMSDAEIDFCRRAHAFAAEMARCGKGMGFGSPPVFDICTIIGTDGTVPRPLTQSRPSSVPSTPPSLSLSSSKAEPEHRSLMRTVARL